MSPRYRIFLSPTAQSMLSAINDRHTLEQIRDGIDGLIEEPELQGKSLLGELKGYHSLRAAGQRYQVLYRVRRARVEVLVVAVGRRAEGPGLDVHRLTQRLLRLRLLV